MMKLCLAQTLEGKAVLHHGAGHHAGRGLNSRPIARSKPSEDLTSGGPITPLHLQLGRASIEIPEAKFDLSSSLTKRLKYLEEIKTEFWKMWMAQVFQGKVLAQKWRKYHRDARVGDVTLIKNETAASVEFKRGRMWMYLNCFSRFHHCSCNAPSLFPAALFRQCPFTFSALFHDSLPALLLHCFGTVPSLLLYCSFTFPSLQYINVSLPLDPYSFTVSIHVR
jgi:hypothetical protein